MQEHSPILATVSFSDIPSTFLVTGQEGEGTILQRCFLDPLESTFISPPLAEPSLF